MKRRTHQINAGPALPWWIFAMAAPISYVTLDHIIPSLAIGNPVFVSIANATSNLAPVVALLFGITAAIAALRSPVVSARRSALFNRQRDIDSIRSLSWVQFEHLVGEAYRRRGYRVSENPTKGADDGIDLWLEKNGDQNLVQCKHWKQNVGVSVVREHLGVVSAYNAQRGIIVSSGAFTAAARDFAQQTGIELVGGDTLAYLVSQARSRTSVSDCASVAAEPMPAVTASLLACPECGNNMVRRVARRDQRAGESFMGCSRWPACTGTRSVL